MKNMAFSVYKSPLHEQPSKVIEKRKKVTLEKHLRIPTVQFLFRYHALRRDILLALKSQLFRQNWPKLGSFLSITLQKE